MAAYADDNVFSLLQKLMDSQYRMGRRRKPVTLKQIKSSRNDGIVKIIESWICENWKEF